jgi:prepilin-type N-terminal cleavage/methylation domain-containing protein/prepilin-type processing-associated H-X9-DG protein
MPAGFTLIELLVVIAIIAILASILFPVYSRTREKAHRVKCTSNMKQMIMAFMMYADDHDGHFPGGYDYDRRERNPLWDPWEWTFVFEATRTYYDGETDILNCPTGPQYEYGEGIDRRIVNIAYNKYLYFLGWESESDLSRAPARNSRITVLADSRFPGIYNDTTDEVGAAPGMARIQFANGPGEPRHGNSGNFAFADGHVESIDARKMMHDEQLGLQYPIVNPENRRPF